MVNSHGVCTAL